MRKEIVIATLVAAMAISVQGYTDLRSTACKHSDLLGIIEPEQIELIGEIHLNMSCDPGYDLPLNAPRKGQFVCRADGNSWDPYFFPDCNELKRPTKAFAALYLGVSKITCNDGAATDPGLETRCLQKVKNLPIKPECATNKLGDCKMNNVSFHCSPTPPNVESDSLRWANESELTMPYIFAALEIEYEDTHEYETMKQRTTKLTPHYLMSSELHECGVDSSSYSTPMFSCPVGTVAVVRGEQGDIVCRGCSLGHYLDLAHKKCVQCPPGHYQEVPMQTSCKLCPALASLHKDSQIWEDINKLATGAYGVIFCPTLAKDKDTGELKLKKSSTILGEEDTHKTKIDTGFHRGVRNAEKTMNQDKAVFVTTFLTLLLTIYLS